MPHITHHSSALYSPLCDILLQESTEILLIFTQEKILTYVSPSLKRLEIHHAESALGENITQLIHPEDHQRFFSVLESIESSDDASHPAEFRLAEKDGQEYWLHGTLRNLTNLPGINAYVGSFTLETTASLPDTEASLAFAHQEEALHLLDSLVSKAPLGFAFFDRTNCYVRINEHLAEFNGLAPQDHSGLHISKTAFGKQPEISDLLQHVFRTGTSSQQEICMQRYSDTHSPLFLQCMCYPIENRNGDTLWAGLVVMETTEHRKAERLARESSDLRNMALSSAQIGTWEYSVATRSFYADEKINEIYGFRHTHTVTIEDVISTIHEEDRERVKQALEIALRPESDDHFKEEYRIIRADGRERWLAARGKAHYYTNHHHEDSARFYGTIVDITERKKAEEQAVRLLSQEKEHSSRLSRLAGVALSVNASLDAEMIMRTITEEARWLIPSTHAVCRLSESEGWVQNKMACSSLHGHHYDESLNMNDGISGEANIDHKVVRFTKNDAQYVSGTQESIYGGCLAAPLTGRDGRTLGIIKLSQRLEEQYTRDDEAILIQLAAVTSVALENARLYEEICEAHRRKDQFLATLAHELRNPLAPLRNGLALLKMTNTPEPIRIRARDLMERQLDHMVRLVDDLLDIARITRGTIGLKTRVCDLRDALNNAVEFSTSVIEENNLTLQWQVHDLFLPVNGDMARLTQVFGNLLNNASKYTPEGGEITLRSTVHVDGITIDIEDNGIGIPPDKIEYIFDIFQQADNTLEKVYGGLGLGLTLVKELVELHGGTVNATSKGKNKGSCFTVFLPRPTPMSDNKKDGMHMAEEAHKVLVVDDNEPAAQTLGWILEALECKVELAKDGPDALNKADAFQPDIILLDIGLPGMNGYDICKELRKKPHFKKTIIVAQTGWGQQEHRERSKEAGFDRHMVKPIDMDVMQELLDSLSVNDLRAQANA
jgi:PAS domain S-box-containing protein